MTAEKQISPGDTESVPLVRTDDSLLKRAKHAWKAGIHQVRAINAASRPLPDAIVLGEMRTGSTFLRGMLDQHPQAQLPSKKEVHFFDYNFHRGENWYRAFFPRRKAGSDSLRYVDCTAGYFFHPLAPERVAQVTPDARLIVVLRNPVERAISHYFLERRRGREQLEPAEAFAAEAQRLAGEEERIRADDRYPAQAHRYFSYQARGVYVRQLRRWESWLDRGQLLVIQSEELYADPLRVCEEVFRFVGVDPAHRNPDLSPRHVGHNREPVPAEVIEQLQAYFQPYNEELERFLGRRFHWENEQAHAREAEGADQNQRALL